LGRRDFDKHILRGKDQLELAADVAEPLIGAVELQVRIKELGEEISRDYEGKEVLLIGVLKGAVMFISDLARHISVPLSMDFMAVSSYGESTESSGVVRIMKDLDKSIDGKYVLIVEDIVDTGLTLRYLRHVLKDRSPASLKICTLLDKEERRQVEVELDYVGFSIPGEFVVGYGLDYAEMYRNIPGIYVLKPAVYEGEEKE